jgi:hypothetical protein
VTVADFTDEKSLYLPNSGPSTLHRLRQQLRSRHTANHRPQQPCVGPRHAPRKTAPVDAIAYGLRNTFVLLHHFVFLELIQINFHLILIALYRLKLARRAFIPAR